MPLPKAPSKPADILDDYGEAARPEGERALPEVKNVIEDFEKAAREMAATAPAPAAASAAGPAKPGRRAAQKPAKAVKAVQGTRARRTTEQAAPAAELQSAEPTAQTTQPAPSAPAVRAAAGPARRKAPAKRAALFAPAPEPDASEEAPAAPAPALIEAAEAKAAVRQAKANGPTPAAEAPKAEAAASKKGAKTPKPAKTAKTAKPVKAEKFAEGNAPKTPKAPAPAERIEPQPAEKPAQEAPKKTQARKPAVAKKAPAKQAAAPAPKPAVPSAQAAQAAAKDASARPVPEEDRLLSRQGNAGRRGRAATPGNKPRLYVLDTNVLMHDPLSLFSFAEHDVFLPMTTLEELDEHKKGLTDVARNARTVSRSLDALIEASEGRITEGVPLSLLGNEEASGRLWFETRSMREELPAELPAFRGDNSILGTVRGVQKAFPERAVVLVSKDINMRIKATTLGIPAEDYFSDKVLDDSDLLYSGKVMLEPSFWNDVAPTLRSWQESGSTFYAFETNDPAKFVINACLWVDGDENFMATVTSVQGRVVTMRLMKDYRAKSHIKVWGVHARNREQNMALNLLMDPEIDFVTILGQAGTGKTLMTLAAALTQTIDERRFSEIIVTRATVSVGEDIGYLPGTEEEKMAPWMGALEDNLEVLHGSQTGGEWGRQATMDLIRNRIRVKSMSFMRGRTFLQKFVIIDEAQNLSPKQMKTLITRAGPGTKIVCLGNISQIDTPYLTEGSSGLTYVVERFQGWAHAATITLTRGERSRLADFATEVL